MNRLKEKSGLDVVNARFSAISSELEAESVSAMPKERFLALLDKDARKYAGLGYVTDLALLREKVTKYPWDDCAKFLAERGEILQKIESLKVAAEIIVPESVRSVSYGRADKSRTIKKEDVENGFYAEDRLSGYPSGETFDKYSGFPTAVYPSVVRRPTSDGFSGGRFEQFGIPKLIPRNSGSEVYLSFGPAAVPPAEIMTFQAMPQFSFGCTRLLIPSYAAPGFRVHDLRVGRDSLFNSNPIPAAAFTENTVGLSISLDVVVGLIIALMIENVTQDTCMFSAALCGVRR